MVFWKDRTSSFCVIRSQLSMSLVQLELTHELTSRRRQRGLWGEKAAGRDHTRSVEHGGDGPHVDRHVGKRPRRDATTSLARRNAVEAGREAVCAVVRHVGTVAAHGRRRSVEDGRVDRVECVLAPIPVGLVPLVPALVPERLLIRLGKETVPRQEVGCAVDRKRLVDVDGYKIVVSRFRPQH